MKLQHVHTSPIKIFPLCDIFKSFVTCFFPVDFQILISLPQLHNHEFVEVCMKILYQVELHRTTLEQMWGFSVEAELIENAERQDELCCYVSRVEDKSVAMQNGKFAALFHT